MSTTEWRAGRLLIEDDKKQLQRERKLIILELQYYRAPESSVGCLAGRDSTEQLLDKVITDLNSGNV